MPGDAQIAFLGQSFVLIELHHTDRTAIQAGTAASAQRGIDKYDSITALGYGVHRAGGQASRVGAVKAVADGIPQLELAGYLFWAICGDYYPPGAHGYLVLLLTGDFTGFTTDAIGIFYD